MWNIKQKMKAEHLELWTENLYLLSFLFPKQVFDVAINDYIKTCASSKTRQWNLDWSFGIIYLSAF